MSNVVIKVEHLSKKYIINHQSNRKSGQSTLRDSLTDSIKNIFNKNKTFSNEKEEFWALNDISFEIREGERVGIIGRNGAGKSTLLKILSRITEPTNGKISMCGRVASLLEVGTGFHQELTGRENIFLNGAILGMSKQEIQRKFDEIVAFSEVEKFLDTPVKRYSSGMYVRLAFAVAAHLEPEILIIDEVLAVGDAKFQKKCLGKMEDVSAEGRTILFVSHNMAIVQSLCDRGIFLTQGQVTENSSIDQAISAYLISLEQNKSEDLLTRTDRRGNGKIRIAKVKIYKPNSTDESLQNRLQIGDKVAVKIGFVGSYDGLLSCIFTIYENQGQAVVTFNSSDFIQDQKVTSSFICEIGQLLLMPGRYRLNIALMINNTIQDHLEGAAFFDVEQGIINGHPVLPHSLIHIYFPHDWNGE